MDKIKNKYEIILGFATLVISLSAFKDELSKINLELGYASLNLADYFLYCVYGFSICLYFYIIENIFRDTKIGKWKFWDYLLNFAFVLFIVIISTPIILLLNVGVFKVVNSIHAETGGQKSKLYFIINLIMVIAVSFSIVNSAIQIIKRRKVKQQEEIEEQEIKELDNANKLFNDGYYSQSILESFKVIETYLYKQLLKKDIRVQPYKFNDLMTLSIKYHLISENDIPTINNIRSMRNSAAHTNADFTKEQALIAIDYVRKLLERNQ